MVIFKEAAFERFLIGTLAILGINTVSISKTLAFNVVPSEVVTTSITKHDYYGLGYSYDKFSVNVANNPSLTPDLRLTHFTISLTPPRANSIIAPPRPQVFSRGFRVGIASPPLTTASGWELVSISQVPDENYCSVNFCQPKRTINIPTLTFQALSINTGIAPGSSLGEFAIPYNNGCGIYCGNVSSQFKVIDATFTPVPEPLTILGSAVAIGFGIAMKRKL